MTRSNPKLTPQIPAGFAQSQVVQTQGGEIKPVANKVLRPTTSAQRVKKPR